MHPERGQSLRSRILRWFLILALLPLLVSSGLTYYNSSAALHREVLNNLDALAASKAYRIETYLQRVKNESILLAGTPALLDVLERLGSQSEPRGSQPPAAGALQAEPFLGRFAETFNALDLLLLSTRGRVLHVQRDRSLLDRLLSEPELSESRLAKVFEQARTLIETNFSDFAPDPRYGQPVMLVATPVFHEQQIAGVIVAVLGNEEFTRVVNDYTGLGRTGETMVGIKASGAVVLAAPTRHGADLQFRLRVEAGGPELQPLQQAARGAIGRGRMTDYRRHETLAAWRYLPSLDGGMVVKIDRDEALAPVQRQRDVFLLLLGLTTLGVVISAVAVSRSVAGPVAALTRLVQGMEQQLRAPDFALAPVTARDEIGVLHRSFNQMASQLRGSFSALEEANATLEQRVAERTAELQQANAQISELNHRLSAENLRMGAELAITKRLQRMVLPREHELAQIPHLDISGFMEPASEVGGDYYDVLQQDGRVLIGIGDVTGHGLESGVLMLMAQMAVRTLIANEETDSVQFLTAMNRAIHENVKRMDSDRNLTLCLLDYREGVFLLSGQHEEIILVRTGGEVERVDTVDLGFPIGLVGDISGFVAQARIQLQPGDVMVLYTDGITEAESAARQYYGIERLCEVIRLHRQASAQGINEAIVADLRQHIGQHTVFDDITLLVLKQR